MHTPKSASRGAQPTNPVDSVRKSGRPKKNRSLRSRQSRRGTAVWVWIFVVGIVALASFFFGRQHVRTKYGFVLPAQETANHHITPLRCTESEEVLFRRLQSELISGGADVSKVQLGTTNGLRGLQTRSAVAKGQVILSVPLSWSISAASFSGRDAMRGIGHVLRKGQEVDVMLDMLALMYERYGRQGSSRWATYMCLLPEQYNLPFNYSSRDGVTLVANVPELMRLVDKRRNGLVDMAKPLLDAMQLMPGARPLFDAMGSDGRSFRTVFSWAYAATKTRTVQVELSRAEGFIPVSSRFKGLVSELGAMVPVLDLANHASGTRATAHFAVRLRTVLPWLFPPQHWLFGHDAQSLHFSLVAARDLKAGEEVTFSYLPEDDDAPRCNERWLLEYGFTLDDGHPGRACYSWNVTTVQVASVLLLASKDSAVKEGTTAVLQAVMDGQPVGGTPAAAEMRRLQQAVESRLQTAQLPLMTVAHVTGDGKISPSLGQWLQAASGGLDEDAGRLWAALLKTSKQQLISSLQMANKSEWVTEAFDTSDAGSAGRGGAEADNEGRSITDSAEVANLKPVYIGALQALQRSLLAVSGKA